MVAPTSAMAHSATLDIQNEDLAPICNGTGKVRWISLSEYYKTGKINVVEPPASSENEQTDNTQTNCPICSLFTQIDDDNSALIPHTLFIDNSVLHGVFKHTQHAFKQETASANSRAPPVFS